MFCWIPNWNNFLILCSQNLLYPTTSTEISSPLSWDHFFAGRFVKYHRLQYCFFTSHLLWYFIPIHNSRLAFIFGWHFKGQNICHFSALSCVLCQFNSGSFVRHLSFLSSCFFFFSLALVFHSFTTKGLGIHMFVLILLAFQISILGDM